MQSTPRGPSLAWIEYSVYSFWPWWCGFSRKGFPKSSKVPAFKIFLRLAVTICCFYISQKHVLCIYEAWTNVPISNAWQCHVLNGSFNRTQHCPTNSVIWYDLMMYWIFIQWHHWYVGMLRLRALGTLCREITWASARLCRGLKRHDQLVKHHQVVQQLSFMTLCGALCLVFYWPPMNQEYSSSGGSAGYNFNQHIDVKALSDHVFFWHCGNV